MEELILQLKRVIANSGNKSSLYLRNLLKVYLQVLVLDFIYGQSKYKHLVFYGGSCLHHLFGLPRLSEDLDFVDFSKKTSLKALEKDLENHFLRNYLTTIKTARQKFRIYLKFPILKMLNLAKGGESDLLFVKVEIFIPSKDFGNYITQITPYFKNNKSLMVVSFDLPTLMATKINAILNRRWERVTISGEKIIAKGRDYFDLMWYLQKGIKPNMSCVWGVGSLTALKKALLTNVGKLDHKSVVVDLEAFIDNAEFSQSLGLQIKDILKGQVNSLE